MWGDDKTTTSWAENESLDCRDQPSTVVAMTVVVVFCTVVINGVTMAPLMKLLKMTDRSASRKMMLNGSYSKLREETDKCIKHLRHEETFFKGVNWDSVRDVDLQHFEYLEGESENRAAWLMA